MATAAVAALTAGAVVAVLAPVAALAGGAATGGAVPTPVAPPSDSSQGPGEVPRAAETSYPPQPWRGRDYVRYTPDGELEIRPGVEVLHRVDDYLAGTRWVRSVALEIRFRGEVSWVDASQLRNGHSSSGWSEPSDAWADFRAWVADQAAANGVGEPLAGGGYPPLVEVRGDGTFGELPGATVLAQQADPELPASFAPASETTGAAYVERDGTRYLVLSRPGDLVVVPAAGHGASLGELLAWARQRYESGEGLL